ncbi:triose-phosphate isomerase [Rothia sp. LK2588]|uniref:triose-phosphate isomerase n=1 Tax=Rothia sp. LK2588 TaxID=3114369 RepID=UPI0034CE599D
MARKPFIAGNWKMNMDHTQAVTLLQKLAWTLDDTNFDYEQAEVVIFPPFTDIRSVQTLVEGDKLKISYGAQDLSDQDSGAYTGDISGEFLAKLGASYALVGHSERRTIHQETDEICAAKIQAAYRHNLTPVLCVGEGLETREEGKHVEFTLQQVRESLAGVTAEQAETIVIAYEPVWAIGTGKVATAQDAQEMSSAIRQELGKLYSDEIAEKVRVLYGGSVKAASAPEIMAEEDVDGVLVGGASLDATEFANIARFDSK